LRSELLRDAVIQNNPKAFPKGNAKSMVIGSTLSMPDQAYITQKLLSPNAASALTTVTASQSASPVSAAATPASPAGGGGAAAHSAGHNTGFQDSKRHWVRYP
jgi:Tfp pilus assembly protein FimV